MNPILMFSFAQVAFFAMMWLSKSVHLLYFESQNAVTNFGLSYSAMALAGYFSFLTGHLTDRIGLRKTLASGVLLYAIGLFLRAFPNSPVVAISSGLIAGIGASTALSAFRVWMVSLSTEQTTSRMIGLRTSTTAFGTACGCFLVAGFPFLNDLGFHIDYRNLLLFASAGLLLLSVIFAFHLPSNQIHISTAAKPSFLSIFHELYEEHRKLVLITMILGVTTGFYVSFISPYLPLIMKDKGLGLSAIGLSTGILSLIRFFIDPQIAKWVGQFREKSLSIYLGSELLIAVVTGCFIYPSSKTGFILLLVMRSSFLGFSAISEELLWLGRFPKNRIGLFFGLNQSAYFIGDFIGGLLNGYLYKDHGLDLCIEAVLAIMLLNGSLFLWLFKRNPKTRLAEARVAS